MHHLEALALGGSEGRAELTIAALQDLAELRLDAGDPDGAEARLAEAAQLLSGDLVFGWRLAFKHQLLTSRLALLLRRRRARAVDGRRAGRGGGRPGRAAVCQRRPADWCTWRAGPWACLPTTHRYRTDLDLLDRSAAIEAWRWTGEVGAAFGSADWLARAEERVSQARGPAQVITLRSCAGQQTRGSPPGGGRPAAAA